MRDLRIIHVKVSSCQVECNGMKMTISRVACIRISVECIIVIIIIKAAGVGKVLDVCKVQLKIQIYLISTFWATVIGLEDSRHQKPRYQHEIFLRLELRSSAIYIKEFYLSCPLRFPCHPTEPRNTLRVTGCWEFPSAVDGMNGKGTRKRRPPFCDYSQLPLQWCHHSSLLVSNQGGQRKHPTTLLRELAHVVINESWFDTEFTYMYIKQFILHKTFKTKYI